ncbi:hypothetical protein C0Q70_03016 [Pomacea canaliculata]|uniref:Uncharacterized protein n=2 Tax=Pomacea canaliculata TaxID=400727 RepID=A0A2T7PRJ6_POMCA|nr:uncharacterized protein LOC112557336 isoform X2 [Pomacea canaliculata]PVD36046.1 hypothetical protein C0Q70_03016 [Pomacea canaliculata]
MLRHPTTPLIAALLCILASVSQAHSSVTLLKLGDREPSLPDEVPVNEATKLGLSHMLAELKGMTVKELEEKDTTESSEAAKGDELEEGAASKRLDPRAFFGSRGKRRFSEKSFKRLQTGFVGSRGKRLPMPAGDEGLWEGQEFRSKRFDPSGFAGSRGKRYFPGLEALVLSHMYPKLDAGKWKRQFSHFGFQAARG